MSTNTQTPTLPATTRTAEEQAKRDADFQRLLDQPHEFNAFGNEKDFASAQRMAKLLSASTIVPDNFQGEKNFGNCVIAVEIANRIGASVLAVMQNIVIVHGKPSWSAQFLISCLNASRRFSPIRYELKKGPSVEVEYKYNVYEWSNGQRNKTVKQGKEMVPTMECHAWAYDKSGEKLEGPPVTIEMAVKEGWYAKDGSKWKTMPELMIRYRAATFFTRLYAPELTMGIKTMEELFDAPPELPVIEQEPTKAESSKNFAPEFVSASAGANTPPAGADENPSGVSHPAAEDLPGQGNGILKKEQVDAIEAATAKEAGKSKPETQPELGPAHKGPQQKLQELLGPKVKFEKLRDWANDTDRLTNADSYGTWEELPAAFCAGLIGSPKEISRAILRCSS